MQCSSVLSCLSRYFHSEFLLVILLTILVSFAYHVVRDVCRESNRSKRYGQLACSTCVLPEPSPNVVDVEVGESGFVEAAHSSVVEVISDFFLIPEEHI
jgi:hypothetical protein